MDVPGRIYNQSLRDGMPSLLSEFITAQSGHETGGWTSDVFEDCNNCFGYDWVGQTTALGPCPNHWPYAAYSSVEQSVTEITKWIKRRQNDGSFPANLNSITSPSQYASLLKSAGYYTDSVSVYANGISSWLAQLNFGTVAKTGGGILVVGGLLVWIFRKRIFQ